MIVSILPTVDHFAGTIIYHMLSELQTCCLLHTTHSIFIICGIYKTHCVIYYQNYIVCSLKEQHSLMSKLMATSDSFKHYAI